MNLTRYTDYSLRVLTYLSVKPERPITIDEMAAAYGISANHLMKIVHRLGMRGYLRTLRGKKGGVLLGKPPERINLGEVVRWTEDRWDLVECFDPRTDRCRISPACRLRSALSRALNSFFATLDGYTLADLVRPPGALAVLLDGTGTGSSRRRRPAPETRTQQEKTKRRHS